ncbi:uncharacterized protein B0I36DRAFT_313670 [Microdochium trichocladiopsis]|uniref:S-adenosyl-L-methionine-dependent methyltransferase n=1 Tax=Microdochium trichocladiopsis TaxID=1682393 RepID=A0A9P8YE89_9PEZI|nr:uncharacterized protein B0I36DRAFT_313670 [Microdochium trichocladiopsis]KAH7037277.1 hypothetical protein B0I36DRAFT_313670 [Microdochium trichocladiopsis]
MSPLLRSLKSYRSFLAEVQPAVFTSSTTRSMSSTDTPQWPIQAYEPRHQSWPYTAADFTRHDPSPDKRFYREARLVTHIDDAAIATLGQYYDAVLPRKGRLLDFCSSWISHYPESITDAAEKGDLRIIGLGMNKEELAANPVLKADSTLTTDLNVDPDIHKALSCAGLISKEDDSEKLTAATCVVSIDYLTNPLQVLESLRRATAPGGMVHLVISNRCFPTKVVSRWLRISEQERLRMVGDHLHFSGWKQIEIVELSDGSVEDNGSNNNNGNNSQGLASLMRFVGVGMSRDPLWVVRATKQD